MPPISRHSEPDGLDSDLEPMKGEEASPPTWVKPKLVALVKQAPDGPDLLHEIKFDALHWWPTEFCSEPGAGFPAAVPARGSPDRARPLQ